MFITTQSINPQLNLFITKNNEWITWTNEGYFNASEKGMEYIYFHLNHGVEHEAEAIPLERFYDHFFRPDLIQLKLDGNETKYQEAIKGLDFKMALENPPPIIKFDKTVSKTMKKKIKLSFTVKDETGGIGLIRIYQEGKLIKVLGKGKVNPKRAVANYRTQKEQDENDERNNQVDTNLTNNRNQTKGKGGDSEDINTSKSFTRTQYLNNNIREVEIELIAGRNEITIEAFNKTNLVASIRDKVLIDADIPKNENPKLHAIVVGINEFKGGNFKDLRYAEADAKAIIDTLENNVSSVFKKENIEIISLLGNEVTKVNILRAIKIVEEKAKLEDTILFFISTHGSKDSENELYFISYNSQEGSNWIEFKETFQAIQKIKSLNQIFIVDACESGAANDYVSAIYDSKASVFAKKSGVHMLLATTRGAVAKENEKLGQGVFTKAILDALSQKKTDENNNSFISVVELSKALKESAKERQNQYPVIRNVGRDVELERVE